MAWEYHMLVTRPNREEELPAEDAALNRLGAEGWELVGLARAMLEWGEPDGNGGGARWNTVFYFKRPARP